MYLSCFTIFFNAVLLSQDLNFNAEYFIGLRHTDVPFKQTSSIAVAGAVIGAVLALFIIAVFVTVLLTPRKKRPSYLDKTEHLPLQTQKKEREICSLPHSNGLNSKSFDDENPAGEDGIQQMYPLYNQMCYQDRSPGKHHQNNDPKRVYINPREHYV
uniref:Nectin cell adhesion molecule 3 n=1 Tax=Ictidomys tridecemlineatus TaxID=43179 RepID=A0A287CWH7_ICTTR